jgi:bifunctional non-homologous end joining protein LigD
MSLKAYHKKRDFKRTREPHGKLAVAKKPQFLYVIQKHAASHLHYDLRLELNGVLVSWAVPKGPSLDPKVKHLAMHVEDHPIEYVDFEGIIPQGEYGGGTVMVWDIGKWQPLDQHFMRDFNKGNLTFVLLGKKLHGLWKLIKLKRPSYTKGEPWLLFKVRDDYSRSAAHYDITQSEPDSALTKRSLQQIAQGEAAVNLPKISGARKMKLPMAISPQLATLVVEPPQGEQWLHEVKWDGYRLITRVGKTDIKLLTRHHNDWTEQFPSLVSAFESLKLPESIFDGEVVALDRAHKADFQILQNSMAANKALGDLIYYVFDLLYYDGYDLMAVPLLERKQLLQKILQSKSLSPAIKYNDHVIGNGPLVYQRACEYSLEGIVSKRVDSLYIEKRTKQWLKIKCSHRQEFVIAGYTDPKSSRQFFGALILGYYKSGQLIYCGRVGTGFTQETLKQVADKIKRYRRKTCPLVNFPSKITKTMHWLTPKLVAEIAYLAMTHEGVLRHPAFKGLREDKPAKEVTLELADAQQEATMQLTNLDRVLYPEQGLTKGDLLTYYESIADWILPYIKDRPLTVVRCPDNYKECFYQKRMNETVPSVIKSVMVMEHGKKQAYLTIDNREGLLGLVQMGVLEIHPWGSSNEAIEKPNWMVFDLDPAPDVAWKEVVVCAQLMQQFFDFLKLKTFVKTTGGKGLHVVIPIKPDLMWQEIRDITKRIAEAIVAIDPGKYIATMSKAKRKGKIFIDYVRNTRGATAIAPYATRARLHAPVAMPIAWQQLSSDLRSDSFTMTNAVAYLQHLKTDPWQEFFQVQQAITRKMRKELGIPSS